MLWLALVLMALHPDLALVERALAGRAAQRRMLVNRLTPVIWAHVRRGLITAGMDPQAFAVDLTQHIWLRLWSEDGRLLRRFEPARASLEHYVGRIVTRSEVRDWLRARAASRRGGHAAHLGVDDVAVASSAPSASARVADADLGRRVFAHLDATLTGRGRVIFHMIYADEMSATDIATALGVATHVVHNWQARIRKAARAFLAEHASGTLRA